MGRRAYPLGLLSGAMRIWTPVSGGVGVPFTADTFTASGVIAAMYAPGRVLPYAIGTPA